MRSNKLTINSVNVPARTTTPVSFSPPGLGKSPAFKTLPKSENGYEEAKPSPTTKKALPPAKALVLTVAGEAGSVAAIPRLQPFKPRPKSHFTAGQRLRTVGEVADHLHVAPSTIRRWIREGRLSAFKIGVQVRISQAEIEALLHASLKH
jgi:excisionase family DNA binding protein